MKLVAIIRSETLHLLWQLAGFMRQLGEAGIQLCARVCFSKTNSSRICFNLAWLLLLSVDKWRRFVFANKRAVCEDAAAAQGARGHLIHLMMFVSRSRGIMYLSTACGMTN